jgi:hypothetical protein
MDVLREALSRIEAASNDRYDTLLSRIEEVKLNREDEGQSVTLQVEEELTNLGHSSQQALYSQTTWHTSNSTPTVSNSSIETIVRQQISTPYLSALVAATKSIPATIGNLNFVRDQISRQSTRHVSPSGEFNKIPFARSASLNESPDELLSLLDTIMYVQAEPSL